VLAHALKPCHCSPFAPKRFTKPPLPSSNSVMLSTMVLLSLESVYHSPNVVADCTHVSAMGGGLAAYTGSPAALNVGCTIPVTATETPPAILPHVTSKSFGVPALKS
jgi:hypothetical protein